MRRVSCVIAAALAIFGAVVYAPPAAASAKTKNGPVYALNWSGYVVQGKPITEVRGSWMVPSLKLAPPGFSSSWIGIGGFGTSDLIQVGTATSHFGGHYAWYEMLPDYAIPLEDCAGDADCRVVSNDTMSAAVVNTGGDNWVLAVVNFGKQGTPKWQWSKSVTYKSSFSSAEWIFEAPMVGIAPVGGFQMIPSHVQPAKFFGGTYRINGGAPTPLRPGATRVIMAPCLVTVNGHGCNVHMATPSLLAPDGHFQVCTYKPKCPNF